MRSSRSFLALALTVAGLALPLQAQTSKKTAQSNQVVSALLAVSPDMLGGRLGLDLATARTPSPALVVANEGASRVAMSTPDQVAYKAWKAGKKS